MDICVRHLLYLSHLCNPRSTTHPSLRCWSLWTTSTNCLTSGFLLGLTNVGALGRDKRKGRKYDLGIILLLSPHGVPWRLRASSCQSSRLLTSGPLHTAPSPSALEPTPPLALGMALPLASMSVFPYSHLTPLFTLLSLNSSWMITIWRCNIFHGRTLTNRTTISIAEY